jgi:hypothetical protein
MPEFPFLLRCRSDSTAEKDTTHNAILLNPKKLRKRWVVHTVSLKLIPT